MALTLESVTDELDRLDSPDLDATCRAIAHGSLMGARGNSGVILSQLLRGLTEGLNCPSGRPGPIELSEALTIADKLAREAVMRPVEGTILTVARGAAEGALGRGGGGPAPGRRGRGVPGGGRRSPGPDALAPARAGAGGRGGRRRHRLPAPARRPADRGGRAGACRALGTAGHPVRAPQPRGSGYGSTGHVREPGGRGRPATPWPGSATRSCTSSRPPTTPSPRSRRSGPDIGDSIVVVGGDGPVELPHPHRRHRRRHRGRRSMPADPATCGSPTSWSRWRRSAGCAKAPAPWAAARRPPRQGRPRPPAWWPWPPATASGASSARSASRG